MLQQLLDVLPGDLAVGQDVFGPEGRAMDDLYARCGVQLTQRRLWQQMWLELNPRAHVWSVSVKAGKRLDGVLVLHETAGATGERVVRGLCPRGDDRLVPALASPAAGRVLARTMATVLGARKRPWSLALGPVPLSDGFLRQLQGALPGSRLVSGASIPLIDPWATRDLCSGGSNDMCLSTNLQRNLRKASNRLAVDGRSAHIEVVRGAPGIDSWLTRVWQLRCERDAFVGRPHADADGILQRFWRESLRAHANLDLVELSLLHIDRHLAAYTLALTEPGVYRVLEGRFDSALARYNPGRLLEADVVRRVVCREGRQVDWMNGVAPEKLVAATTLEPTQWLHAEG